MSGTDEERSSGLVYKRVRRFRGFDRGSRAAIVSSLFARDGTFCAICGEALDPSILTPDHPAAITIDHVIALGDGGEVGGEDRLENLRLSHSRFSCITS